MDLLVAKCNISCDCCGGKVKRGDSYYDDGISKIHLSCKQEPEVKQRRLRLINKTVKK